MYDDVDFRLHHFSAMIKGSVSVCSGNEPELCYDSSAIRRCLRCVEDVEGVGRMLRDAEGVERC